MPDQGFNLELLDYETSRSICDGVGERLQQNFRPEQSELPPYLRDLMDELRRQDNSVH